MTALWRDRNFAIFWLSQALSTIGDSFSYVAVPLLVLHATGSVAQMGLLTGLTGVASILCGVFAGVLVDRLDRRRLLIACDFARAALYLVVPLAWWLAGPQIWLLYVVMPLGSAIGMLFQVSYVAAVRGIVARERITEANGKLYASYAAAGVAGPVLAGLVSSWFGPTAAIAIDAVSFVVCGLGMCLVRLRAFAAEGGGAPWASFLVGVRFLWGQPVLRALTGLLSFLIFLTLGLTDLFIYHLKHDLRQPDGAVGFLLTCGAVGTIAASLLVARVRKWLGFGASWIGSVLLSGVAVILIGLTGNVVVLAALVMVYLFGISTGGICSMSLRQEVTPEHLLGRVTSAFWTVHSALGPVGAALLTAAAARRGAGPVLVAAGVGCVMIAAAAMFTPVRQPIPVLAGSVD